MTDKPRLLDICCGVGGASAGYASAGFEVTGVDLRPQPNYPYTFVQDDGLSYMKAHAKEYDVIHTSWPCQGYSIATPRRAKEEKASTWYSTTLIPAARDIAEAQSLHLIQENVPRAARDFRLPYIALCGEMFGLRVIRHRVFEVGGMVAPLPHAPHKGTVRGGQYVTVAGHGADNAPGNYSLQAWRDAMGMPWAQTHHELAEAIPPAYTRYIGEQVLAWL